MTRTKNDRYYIAKILATISEIKEYMDGLDYEDFCKDKKTIAASMWCICQVAEDVGDLSDDLKNKHPEVPWHDIAGFRNRLIHDYGSTDYSIVYQALTQDVNAIEEVLKEEFKK
jgi:uncharacterized protein with HEPN domain